MTAFDPGPPSAYATLFADAPSYEPFKEHFWFDWGPIFYRGRLDGSARILCIASDPGPTERVASRTLVGDAGQRVQGFLTKLGLTRSYLCLNAFTYALHPSHSSSAHHVLSDPDQLVWRNKLYDKANGSEIQAIVAFGANAQAAADLWPGARSPTRAATTPPACWTGGARRSSSCEASSIQMPMATPPDPITAPASLRPTTPPSRKLIFRSACRIGSGTIRGDGPGRRDTPIA
jgi:hypothetical protein